MSYPNEQIVEKGSQPKCSKGKWVKYVKKSRHRKMRQRLKDPNFTPSYNRYNGWYL